MPENSRNINGIALAEGLRNVPNPIFGFECIEIDSAFDPSTNSTSRQVHIEQDNRMSCINCGIEGIEYAELNWKNGREVGAIGYCGDCVPFNISGAYKRMMESD